jgi:RNA recognition motif-containing protein
MNIYIGNLDYDVTDATLKEMFEVFGEVSSASIIIDKFNDRSKGFGFVEMPNKSEAEQAISSLNNTEVDGRALRVNEALPKESRQSKPRPSYNSRGASSYSSRY